MLFESETVTGVEDLSHECRVQLLIRVANVLGLDEHVHSQGLGVFNCMGCSLQGIGLINGAAQGWVQATHECPVYFGVLNTMVIRVDYLKNQYNERHLWVTAKSEEKLLASLVEPAFLR